MSKIIVVSEIDCALFMRAQGFYPAELYTKLELFHERMAFFNDVIVMVLYAGSCIYPRHKMDELRRTLEERAENNEDTGVVDVIVVSPFVLPDCKDYFLYDSDPLKCTRYSGKKQISGEFSLRKLEYEKSFRTITFLSDMNYGFSPNALKEVRSRSEEDVKLASLIKTDFFG